MEPEKMMVSKKESKRNLVFPRADFEVPCSTSGVYDCLHSRLQSVLKTPARSFRWFSRRCAKLSLEATAHNTKNMSARYGRGGAMIVACFFHK